MVWERIHKTDIHAHAHRRELKIVPPRVWEGKTLTLRHLHLNSLRWIWRLPLQINITLHNIIAWFFKKCTSSDFHSRPSPQVTFVTLRIFLYMAWLSSACWVQNGAWLCIRLNVSHWWDVVIVHRWKRKCSTIAHCGDLSLPSSYYDSHDSELPPNC